MIRIGIYGYGNLGKGIEKAIEKNEDTSLFAVFTRRDVQTVKIQTPGALVLPADRAAEYKNEIDVMILCGGSKSDLPLQSPELARNFNIVDSFDTHKKIPEHLLCVDRAAREGEKTAIISAGWDPGMFSLMRLYSEAVLPQGVTATFWGKGVSQGHSDAIRRIEGVLDAKQYTVPKEEAVISVREKGIVPPTPREKHERICYVVLKEGADAERVRSEIITMPDYFADYDTEVHFISMEELVRVHSGIPHGGTVIRSGQTSDGVSHGIEYSLRLDSNPEFTSSVLVAFARAAYRMSKKGQYGCSTVFDIPPVMLSCKERDTLISELL